MIKKSRQQFKYLENKKCFEDEINSILHHFFKGPSLEVVSQRSFVKNVYKQISQNSCARVSFLIKRDRHKYFPVNFVKFVRTPFFIDHLLFDGSKFLWNVRVRL